MVDASSKTDEEIAKSVQSGDVEAFGILVERYEQKMKRYARRFLLGSHDAEDIAQDVFLKCYTNIQSFDVKRRFSPWIYRIAHNELVNRIKKKGREPLPFFDADTIFPHPVAKEKSERGVEMSEARELVEKTLDKLTPYYREVLVLYYIEELSYEEISDIIQIPISTVGVRLKRAKESMKKVLEKHG